MTTHVLNIAESGQSVNIELLMGSFSLTYGARESQGAPIFEMRYCELPSTTWVRSWAIPQASLW